MSNLSKFIPEAPAFGQIAEGGANAHDNCIPDAFAYLGKCYGLTYVPPQVWTLDEYGIPAPGATSVQAAIAESHHLYGTDFPGCIGGSPDLAALDSALNMGCPAIILAYVDCPTVRYVGGACGHAGILVGHENGNWIIWNPWFGSLDLVPDAVFGNILYYQAIFEKSIGGIDLTKEEHDLLVAINQNLNDFVAKALVDFGNLWSNGGPVIQAMKTELDALAGHSDPAVATAVFNLLTHVSAIETALKTGRLDQA